MTPLKILLVRVSSLGDVLHNLPMVADILRHHPDAVIDWVVEEGYVSLVRLNPHVRTIIPFALRRWRKSLGRKRRAPKSPPSSAPCAPSATTTCSTPRACSRPA